MKLALKLRYVLPLMVIGIMIIIAIISPFMSSADSSNFANWNNGSLPSSGWNFASHIASNCYPTPSAGSFTSPTFSTAHPITGSTYDLAYPALTAGLSGSNAYGGNVNQTFILANTYTVIMSFYIEWLNHTGGNTNQFFTIAGSCGSGQNWALMIAYSFSSYCGVNIWCVILQQSVGVVVLTTTISNQSSFTVAFTGQGASGISLGQQGTTGAASGADIIKVDSQQVCINNAACNGSGYAVSTTTYTYTNFNCTGGVAGCSTFTSTTAIFSTTITQTDCTNTISMDTNGCVYTVTSTTAVSTAVSTSLVVNTVNSTRTVYQINAPNPASFTFWFYPLLFIGLGIAVFTAPVALYKGGNIADVDQKTLMTLVFAGSTVGTLFGVGAGLINFVWPILMLSLAIIYFWATR